MAPCLCHARDQGGNGHLWRKDLSHKLPLQRDPDPCFLIFDQSDDESEARGDQYDRKPKKRRLKR